MPLEAARHEQVRLHVLLADDQLLYTDALKFVLEERGIELDAVASYSAVLDRLGSGQSYDLILLDWDVVARANDCLSAIVAGDPDAKVAVIATGIDSENLNDLIRRGAAGVLTKNTSLTSLAVAIKFMAEGETFVPASVLRMVRQRPESDSLQLSKSERRILEKLAIGLPNGVIAEMLDLPESSVKSQIKSIYRKLGVKNRTKAALLARSIGYI
jgi:two-component system, NarL family, nitrate/nitrite response regulator NarL